MCSAFHILNRKLIVTIFLFLFISIFLIQNYLFIKQDRLTVFTDSHLIHSAIYYDRLVLKNDNNISLIGYPPLLYLLTTLYYRTGGISAQGARLLISFFSVIFLLAMFGIGYQLGGYYSGAAVMAIAASSPHILNYSRLYFVDFPQTTLTALAFYLLLRSEGYRHRIPSILLGIAMALSFLVKWSTAFFLILPVLWFFIPVIIKPGKYISQYIVFIITSLFAFAGSVHYLKTAAFPFQDIDLRWFRNFILFIVIPSLVCLTIMYLAEKRFRSDEGYEASSFRKLFNFTLMGTIFCAIALPWYYWNAAGLVQKFKAVSEDFAKFHDKTGMLIDFLRTSFSLFPVFLIFSFIGLFLVFFTCKRGFFKHLILPINLVFIILIMTKILCPGNRYMLSIVIFTSALAGFWVSKTGKLKGILTSFILLISMLSIMSWMIFPHLLHNKISPINTRIMEVGDFPVFPSTKGLLLIQSQPVIVSNAQTRVKPVIDYLFEDSSRPCNRIMIIETGNFGERNFFSEFLKFEIFRLTGKLQTDFDWNWDDYNRSPNIKGSSKFPGFEPEDVDDSITDRIINDNSAENIAVASYFTNETLSLLQNRNKSHTDDFLKRKVLNEFNRLLTNTSFSKEKSLTSLLQKIEPETPARERKRNIVLLNRRILETIYDRDIKRKFRRDLRLELACNSVDCIAIMYNDSSYLSSVTEEMNKLFPGQIFDSKIFEIENRGCIKAMKIHRNGDD